MLCTYFYKFAALDFYFYFFLFNADMQNIFPVIDTHSIKHVINHIIPDIYLKKYISFRLGFFSAIFWFIHKFMDNDIEVRNDLLWITFFSILTFRHCFKLHHHLLFLLFIRVIRIISFQLPPSRHLLPLYASQIRRTPKKIFKNFFYCFFVFIFFCFFCFIFLQYIAQCSRLLGAISCICLHLKK